MTLGVLLNIGESLTTLKTSGQDKRFVDYYLKTYLQQFNKVSVFSYTKERYPLPKNSFLITNNFKLHRFLYTLFMPFLHQHQFKECDCFRVTHLLGSPPAIIAKLLWGRKFVVTYGYDYKKFSQFEGRGYLVPFIWLIEFLNFKLADRIIITNRKIQNYVLRKIDKKRIFYIPNGVDVRLFKPKSRIKNQESRIKILFVGRLEKQKNLSTLIKAVSLLKNQKQIILKFVGDGSLGEDLKKYAAKLGVNLQIIKRVSYNKMPETYQQADIFVLPSLIEGHPKVLLEAMACGLVCIGNNIKEINTVIKEGENGLLFNNKAFDLAKKLEKVLIDKRLREKLGVKARKFVVENFNFQELIKKEIKILS